MGRKPFLRDFLEGLFPSVPKQEPTTTKKKGATKKTSASKSVFVHPKFGDITISRTRQVRRISVSVKRDVSIRLNIPAGYPVQAGLDFLAAKEQWVAAALKRAEANNPNRAITPPYRTRLRELEFRTVPSERDDSLGRRNDKGDNSPKITARLTTDKIIVSFPDNLPYTDEEVQKNAQAAILRALRSEAKELLPCMVEDIARRHGFRCGKVTVRATRSRWGSCSSNNDISLSIFLMRLPDHLIEYIIIHELCHTVHKDHSARFHTLAEQHLGGREKQLRAELRRYRPDIL